MNGSVLTQFLIDVTRGHKKEAFGADPAGVLATAPLDDRVRAAIRAQDIGALWRAGAHPMALMYFARFCGWANERYYACLAEAEVTKGDPASAAPAGLPAPPRTH